MKNSIILILAILFLGSCGKEDLPEQTPDCVQEIIKEIKSETVRNPPGKVIAFDQDDKRYYYVPSYCCDVFSSLYDDECNLICAPDGGITGGGSGTCPEEVLDIDWNNGTLIWEDDRG